MSERGRIFGLQRFSTEDGPGIRTTVFVKGCPMRCPWCQNPEGISPDPVILWAAARCLGDGSCEMACPTEALRHRDGETVIDRDRCQRCATCADTCPTAALEVAGCERRAGELVEELARDQAFYDSSRGGVTFSGGEPLSQPSFVAEALERLGRLGIHRAVDTCGAVGQGALSRMLDLVELVLFDLKQLDPQLHQEQTGVPLEQVLARARQVAAAGVAAWVRTPVIPGYTDSEENIAAIATFIAGEMPQVTRYELLAFSRLGVSKYRQLGVAGPDELPLVSRERMERLRQVALDAGLTNVAWSGMTRTA